MIKRADYHRLSPKVMQGVNALTAHLTSIDERLRALIELRVSQINGCVFLRRSTFEQARRAGETQQRLDCLNVWHECLFFDERERAALAWAEALTHLAGTHAPDHVYGELMQHFSEKEIIDLTWIISLMNVWNRMAVGLRNLPTARNT